MLPNQLEEYMPENYHALPLKILAALPGIGLDSLYPGYFELPKGLSAYALYVILKGNYQTPVKVTQPSFRNTNQLSKFWSDKLLFTEKELKAYWNTDSLLSDSGVLDTCRLMSIFIPETHLFYWTVTPEAFMNKIHKAYSGFWNQNREQKADSLGLQKNEVIVLASIVQEESNIKSEMPKIAGVYINRLRKSMRLQADPTVRYILGFNINRILYGHLATDSPYNTYKIYGLPPGPLNTPNTFAIDAVLNAEQHEYLYFCADSDFSGRHRFAENFIQHRQNARAYQKALNQRTKQK